MAAALISNETASTKERLLYMDNLRLLVIVLVVSVHLAVTVSNIGSWYYVYNTHLDTLSTVWFAWYQSFTQGYFLGLLFMISGYFVASSYDRKGFGGFVGDRFKRLIIPTLIFMIAIDPFIGYIELGNKLTSFNLISFLSATGPMWFAAALFGFCLIYGLVRLMSRRSAFASDSKRLELTLGVVVSLILIIAVFAFLIRIVQPIGTSILNFQLCYFSSYIVLFIVGVIAYRNNWLAKINYRAGKRWVIGAFGLGFLVWFVLVAVATATGTTTALLGGLTWQSAAFSLWESAVAVLMSLGLIAVFREKFNRQSKLVKTLSDNSFAVYMFHPMIIIPVTILFAPLVLYPVAKWLLLCVICIPLCFAATYFVFRRIPLLKNVL
ncbi:MAG: acyltransferase family protein [Candidatus Bathyarchaeia archaeon]